MIYVSKGAGDVIAERQMQVIFKGFGDQNDDRYLDELVNAAISYALAATGRSVFAMTVYWPWAKESFKPTNRRRDLIKAAALLIAEIDRIDRAS